MAQNEVVRAAKSIAAALAHSHRRGYVHRDIKPFNFWLGKTPILFDFGIAAKVNEKLSERKEVIVTPEYMCMFAGLTSFSSDLFAFGLSLYEMLTGQNPFAFMHVEMKIGATPQQIFIKWMRAYAGLKTKISGASWPSSLKMAVYRSVANNLENSFADAVELDNFLNQDTRLRRG